MRQIVLLWVCQIVLAGQIVLILRQIVPVRQIVLLWVCQIVPVGQIVPFLRQIVPVGQIVLFLVCQIVPVGQIVPFWVLKSRQIVLRQIVPQQGSPTAEQYTLLKKTADLR